MASARYSKDVSGDAGDGGATAPVIFTVSSGSLNSFSSVLMSAAGSLPGMRRTFSVSSAEPGITFDRNPPATMTGAIVLRISE